MRPFVLFLMLMTVSTLPAQAQFRQQTPGQSGIGITADLSFNQMSGTIGDSIGSGFGVVGAAFYQPTSMPLRYGAGASYTRFSTEGPGDALDKFSVFAMGAWRIADPNTSVVPYLEGTVGYTSISDDAVTCPEFPTLPEDCSSPLRVGRDWSGLELGAVVGVDIPMTESLNIDVSGSFSWLTLGDLKAGGRGIPNTSTTVSTFGIRAGVTFFP